MPRRHGRRRGVLFADWGSRGHLRARDMCRGRHGYAGRVEQFHRTRPVECERAAQTAALRVPPCSQSLVLPDVTCHRGSNERQIHSLPLKHALRPQRDWQCHQTMHKYVRIYGKKRPQNDARTHARRPLPMRLIPERESLEPYFFAGGTTSPAVKFLAACAYGSVPCGDGARA